MLTSAEGLSKFAEGVSSHYVQSCFFPLLSAQFLFIVFPLFFVQFIIFPFILCTILLCTLMISLLFQLVSGIKTRTCPV